MAELKNNVIIQGLSGKFGDFMVFRQRAGKTIAYKAPGAMQGKGTLAQQAERNKFQQAVIYGKAVIADPITKKAYAATASEGRSAYHIALADFLQAPDIDEIDISGYTGQAGQSIRVRITDDFKVKSVKLSIHNEDGSLQEAGNAFPEANGLDWIYTTATANPRLTGDKITVIATDNPDNLSTFEKTL